MNKRFFKPTGIKRKKGRQSNRMDGSSSHCWWAGRANCLMFYEKFPEYKKMIDKKIQPQRKVLTKNWSGKNFNKRNMKC